MVVLAPDYLKEILDSAAEQFQKENGTKAAVGYVPFDSLPAYATTSTGYDLLIGFDRAACDSLAKDTLSDSSSYTTCPFRLSLVIAGRPGGPAIHEIADLAKPEFRRIVIVDPQMSFEGNLAGEVIRRKRLWPKLQGKIINAKSVEHLVSFCNSGEADIAIALESSLSGARGMVVLERLDGDLKNDLVECGVVPATARNKVVAHAFLDLFDSRLCAIYKIRGVYLNEGEEKKQRTR